MSRFNNFQQRYASQIKKMHFGPGKKETISVNRLKEYLLYTSIIMVTTTFLVYIPAT